ncbi:alpha-glucosidase [Leptospira ognonensis]|uniref:Alpha-glucosidase n=1 Tax=Leptospira ognonensis TaxID=2484945 RepID=A0A4R9K507_9LEPT|nr:alpha-glucosidase [Leptospira ognonensis]TGL60264.1 alpha-glucosidase [Leptospira ognonensis]
MLIRFFLYSLLSLFLSCASGQLKFTVEKPTKLNLGSLILETTDTLIQVADAKSGNLFLSLPTTESFVQAGEANASVRYRMASFAIKDERQRTCNHQTITRIGVANGQFEILGTLSGKKCSTEFKFNIKPISEKEIEFKIELSDKTLNRIWLKYASSHDEKFFGFGEQFSNQEFKGKTPFLFTEEQGIGRGDQPITAGANLLAGAGGNEYTTYAPIPHYITSKNRSVFFDNSGYSKFDLSSSDSVVVEFWDTNLQGGLKASIWLGKNPKELVEAYTKKSGRFAPLPDWSYGTWLGVQGGTEKVNSVIEQAKAAGNPITALWIQDWCGRRVTNFGDQLKWRWYADETLYPDFKKFVKDMNAKNIQVLGYINSFLADTDPKKPGDDFTNSLLVEARAKGYLIKNAKGEDYLIQTVGFPAYLIDLTNPAAVKWTKEIIKKNLIDVGLSGWMADFGEWLPYDAKMHSGIDAKVYHNQYPVDWARINREAIKEAGKEGKIIFFTRAGYSYSNAHSTLFWEGDQMVSFGKNDGLPSAILGLTSSGISGYALNHSDIGGYTTISNPLKNYHRTKELLLRWAELSAFTPVFRTHEGNRPLKNWQVYQYTNKQGISSQSDEETVKLFAKIGKLHFALKDYLKELVLEASKTGIPVVRHNYLVEPTDTRLLKQKYQFFLGDDLLVAPITKSGAEEVEVYLPSGDWEQIWTGKIYKGNSEIDQEAPLGKPVAFIRVGGKYESLLRNSLKDLRK